MDLTQSWARVAEDELIVRYQWLETRNASAVLAASNPTEFADIVATLRTFAIYDSDILTPGGNRGPIAARLDGAFADLGWKAVRVNMTHTLNGKSKSAPGSRVYDKQFLERTVSNEGFEVDNFKGRVALDVEWNAKDGNLDRDLSAYRSLYEFGLIDAAVIVTRDHEGIRALAGIDLGSEDAHRRLGTTTTTNMAKLEDRLKRGDAGGCPVLAVGVTRSTWAGRGVEVPQLGDATQHFLALTDEEDAD